jgi:cyclic pyranopterin phosphate synthase
VVPPWQAVNSEVYAASMSAVALGIPRPKLAQSTDDRPANDELIDRFGRVAHDLRISITEKCSLRCTYCMPAEGLPSIPKSALLTSREIARLVRIGADDLGVREVRFTGGEPLVRGDLVEIVALSHEAAPSVSLAMTTNGIGLDKTARALREAGLSRVNVSLDTVNRAHFAELTRRDRLPAVFAGIAGARLAGLWPIKVNAVLMRSTMRDAPDLLAWSLQHGTQLRFIEEMPLDADEAWRRDEMITAADLLEVLGERFSLTATVRSDAASPAEEWLVDGGPATVGIIASVTRTFCDACDRTRVTAEGTVRSCLFSDEETDLRVLLRGGADDHEIAEAWRAAMWNKQAGHGISLPDFVPPSRSMGAIGG